MQTTSHCLLVTVLFLVVGVLGCASDESTDREGWTVQEDLLFLEEDLRVQETDDFYFGTIYDVAVGQDGRIYVADGEAGHLKVLTPKGTPQDTIGRPGEGPGEFRRPSRLGITDADSLYVMDRRLVSVFSPKGEFEYSIPITGATGAPRNMMVPPAGSGVFFAYLPFPETVTEATARTVIRHVESNGTVEDTLLSVRPRQARPDGGAFPFSRRPLFALGPNGSIHYVWSDSLRVTTYDQSGQQERLVEIPFEPVPVRSADRTAALANRPEQKKTELKKWIPETKPALESFLVDDAGCYWFGRPTEHPDSTAWWIAMPEDKRVATVTLPSTVEILTVQHGKAYGRTTTGSGAPALVRYRITRSN